MLKQISPTPDLAAIPPGPELGRLLDEISLAGVPDAELLGALRAGWRQISHLHALHLATMVEIDRRNPEQDVDEDWCTSQIGAALTFTTHRAEFEFAFAQQLVRRLPLVWQALHDGDLDVPKARLFASYLSELTDPQIERICRRLVPRAPGWTTGQLAHRLLREVLAIDPRYSRRRYQKAIRDRGVWGYLADDGTAVMSAHGLAPGEAAAAAERLERLAATIRSAGHPHTEQQLRADLFVRLVDGRYTGHTTEQIVAAMLTEVATEATAPGDAAGTDPDTSGRSTGPPATPEAARKGAASAVPTEAEADRDAAGDTDADTSDTTCTTTTEPPSAMPPAGDSAASAPPDPIAVPRPGMGVSPAQPEGLGEPSEGVRLGVELRVGLATLLGLDDHPGELAGWGPVDADEARRIVARQRRAEWRFAVVDDHGRLIVGGLTRRRPPTADGERVRGGVVEIHVRAGLLTDLARCPDLPSGWHGLITDIAHRYRGRRAALRALDSDPRARHPGPALRRHIQMRDRTCVAPGCRRPARTADQDHTRAHARGGPTVRRNLDPLCPRHHRMKHLCGWTLTQPEPGLFCWRCPLGMRFWTRGETIAADLPEPVPGEPDDDLEDRDGRVQPPPLPIFDPYAWRKKLHPPPPPAPRPDPGPAADDDVPPL